MLTPSKYLRTTSSALVSEALGAVVPGAGHVVGDSSVPAPSIIAEGTEREGVNVENADTTEAVDATAARTAHSNAGL